MEAIGKPKKFGKFQIQKIIDNFETKKIQIKYFNSTKTGGLNFSKFQALYILEKDWAEFKKEIRRRGK